MEVGRVTPHCTRKVFPFMLSSQSSESVRFFPNERRGVDEDIPHISESKRTHKGTSSAVDSSKQKEKVTMKTITAENSKPHLQRPGWRESSGRLLCSFARSWLVLFALVALASTARAGLVKTTPTCVTNTPPTCVTNTPTTCVTNRIVGVTDCNCTNLTIQLSRFCQGPFVVQLGGVTLNGIYNYANQTFTASRPASLSPGTYLLAIWRNYVLLASTNVSLCNCVPCPSCTNCPPGPPGPTGATGATGPTGPTGATGPMGPQGIRGITGATGPMGPAGAMGPAGSAGTNGLNGTNGLVGPAGPAGTNGLNATNGFVGPAGPAGPAGATGATGPIGLTGATGPAGPAGTNGSNGTSGSGSSEYAYVYNLTAQVVPLETAVTFSDNGIGTAGFSHGLGSSDITVVNKGDYKVTFPV